MNPAIGHNGGPSIEGRKESLRTTWAKALFADPETPVYVMAIAWAIHWYSRADGTGAALSNQQLQLICGISQPTATRGKKWLRDNGYVQLRVGDGSAKTQFRLSIPVKELAQVVEEGVVPQTTPHDDEGDQADYPMGGSPTDQGHQTDDGGSPTDDRGVVPGSTYILYRDSIPIQYSSEPPTGGASYWTKQLNPGHVDYDFDGTTLTLVNGTRTRWLLEFHDDEKALDLALKKVAGRIQPNGNRPISVQVEAALAEIALYSREQDRRYEKSKAERQAKAPRSPTKQEQRSLISQAVAKAFDKGGAA